MKNIKKWLVLAALVLVCTVTVSGTIAYLIDKTEEVTNTFSPSSTSIDIEDTVNGAVKSNVVITVGGNTDVYVRARIVGNWCDDNGNIVAPWTMDDAHGEFSNLAQGAWMQKEDYFYYRSKCSGGDVLSTEHDNALFGSYTVKSYPTDATNLKMTILVQSIQCEPKTTVQSEWSVTVNSDGTLSINQ